MNDVWDLVRAERQSLVDDLSGLDDTDWSTPSLVPAWDVHDVLAHLVHNARTTRLGFVGQMVGARFDFDRQNARGVARERRDDPAHTLAAFRDVVGRTSSAPAPLNSRLVEECVHGEDVRRPLALEHEYAPAALVGALTHQLRTSVGLGGGKERAAGLRLVATDVDWAHGAGEEVRARAVALLLAVSGRATRPGELTGEGAARLS